MFQVLLALLRFNLGLEIVIKEIPRLGVHAKGKSYETNVTFRIN